MKLHVDCVPCLCNQVLKAIRLIRPDADDAFIKRILDRVMDFLKRDGLFTVPAPKVGQGVYRIIGEELGDPDPYAHLKKVTNEKAMQYEKFSRDLIDKSKDHLATALKLAIIGNSVDFAAHTPVNIDAEMKNVTKIGIAIDDSRALFADLKTARRILYVGDNSGEIVFDKLLIEEILRQYPAKKMAFAVRGGPIINDAMMADARETGLDKIIPIIQSSQSPGVLLGESPPEFIEAFGQADLIIVKGQGNFEALSESHLPTKAHIYFLLKAKCAVIEDIFKKPIGSLIIKKFE